MDLSTGCPRVIPVINLLFNRLPTGSQGASPRAHFIWRFKYRLSCNAASRLASEIADLGVVAFGVALLLLAAGTVGDGTASDAAALLVVAPLTAVVRTINATKAIKDVCGRVGGTEGRKDSSQLKLNSNSCQEFSRKLILMVSWWSVVVEMAAREGFT